MFDLLFMTRFWSLTGLYALMFYFYRHQCAHAQSAITGRSTLPPVLITIMSFYNALFINWVFLIYYGYKTWWTHAVLLLITGSIGAAMLEKMEKTLRLKRYAWQISVIGIPLVPILLVLMVRLV